MDCRVKINFIKETKLLDKKEDHFKKRQFKGEEPELLFNSHSSTQENCYDQAKKSVGRMPWHQEPKKDVISCEKLR